MTNVYVTQALATERIRQLHAEADDYRRARGARPGRMQPRLRRTGRGIVLAQEAWRSALASPRRFRAFVLAGQLGPGYQVDCC